MRFLKEKQMTNSIQTRMPEYIKGCKNIQLSTLEFINQ